MFWIIILIVVCIIAYKIFGIAGPITVGIIGAILGIIGFFIDLSGSSSRSRTSTGASMRNFANSRMNDPHTCGNCTKYSSTKGECRLNGNHKSAEDSCNNWD
jgi:hypothetical protein